MDATRVADYVNNCQTCLCKRLAHRNKTDLSYSATSLAYRLPLVKTSVTMSGVNNKLIVVSEGSGLNIVSRGTSELDDF